MPYLKSQRHTRPCYERAPRRERQGASEQSAAKAKPAGFEPQTPDRPHTVLLSFRQCTTYFTRYVYYMFYMHYILLYICLPTFQQFTNRLLCVCNMTARQARPFPPEGLPSHVAPEPFGSPGTSINIRISIQLQLLLLLLLLIIIIIQIMIMSILTILMILSIPIIQIIISWAATPRRARALREPGEVHTARF